MNCKKDLICHSKIINKVAYTTLYWLFLVILPFYVAFLLQNNHSVINYSGVIMVYVIFFAPFLYYIPYRKIKFISKKQKIYFFVCGLIVPLFIMYGYIYYRIIEAFNNSSFPF